MLLALWFAYGPPWYGAQATDNGFLGGTFKDPYTESEKRRQARDRQEALREAQEEVIRLKMEAQELRLQRISQLQAKDKQTQRQLLAIERKNLELQDLVNEKLALIESIRQQNIKANMDALLVLSMAYPWMNLDLGGETMH